MVLTTNRARADDPDYEDADPEDRANPSKGSWNNPGYLEQQRRRLPTHKYRRLHLNLPGMPEGTAFDPTAIMDSIVLGRRSLPPTKDVHYRAFNDMSGGSSDDAVLAIAHRDPITNRTMLDLVMSQTGKPPFNPRHAVRKFAGLCKEYGVFNVTGDRYAGETFRQDFQDNGIAYRVSALTKSQLYEALEPKLNAGELEFLDVPKLQEQLLGLVFRGGKIDHQPNEHDDFANAAAGAITLASRELELDVAPVGVGHRINPFTIGDNAPRRLQ